MRPTLPSAALLMLFAFGTTAAQHAESPASAAAPPPGASIYGELAFSETIGFDYNRDGTTDSVQFWIELKAQPAVGKPGTPGARAESGSVSYFVLDLKSGRRIDDWLLGLNMTGLVGGFPVAGEEYPLTNIRVTGNTAQFDLRGSTWTIRDNGDSWEQDDIRIVTGGREREGRFYGGNLTVVPDLAVVTKPADIPENRKCNRCHKDAAVTIAAEGGPHSEFECVNCHVDHRREPPETVSRCLNCHNPHDENRSVRASCVSCHSSHDFNKVEYDITVPDGLCADCHSAAVTQLQDSGTRHMGLACALCHRDEHGAIPSCTDCHGGPHSEKVMARPERCVRCHNGAHETIVNP
jgi:hypothetical protein